MQRNEDLTRRDHVEFLPRDLIGRLFPPPCWDGKGIPALNEGRSLRLGWRKGSRPATGMRMIPQVDRIRMQAGQQRRMTPAQ